MLVCTGALDRVLKRLLWANLFGVVGLLAFVGIALFMPIIRVRQVLNK
jgi:hypothetical protein